jgi:DNA invertase Pin-like site-specific DNA recombinase
MKRIALVYARASKDPKLQRISVDRQVELCTAKAQQLWPAADVRVHRDDGITAADPDVHRPGFTAFLLDVRGARKGELAGIVTNEQSRLTRQGTAAWDELVITLTKAGITEVHTLRSGSVSVAPGSRLIGRLLAVVDAEEVERTKARVQDAHRQLFKEGRPSGRAPFGYRSTRDAEDRPVWERDKDEAAIVEQIFDKALAGHAISVIVDWLNTEGIAPRAARWRFKDGRQVSEWKPTTVRKLLTSPSVAGLRAHTDENGRLHTNPAQWDALIDESRWRQVQHMLGQPTVVMGTTGQAYAVRTKPAPKARKHLLSGGVLVCGKCGTRMTAQTQGRRDGSRVNAYQCDYSKHGPGCGGISISPADEVEKLVVEAIQRRLSVSPKLRKRLDAAQNGEAAQWRAERDAAKGRLLYASEQYGSGAIDQDEYDAMRRPARAALEHAEARLASLTTDVLLPSSVDVQERWDKLTLRQQRAAVERLIGRIEVARASGGRRGFDPERLGTPEWLA